MISIKNIILPNKPLNNFELEDAAKKLKFPCFRGVFLLDTSRYITGIPAHTHTICHVIIFRDNKLTQNCRSITCARLEYNKLPPYCISRIISYHKIVFLRLSTACSLALLRSGHGSISAPIARPGRSKPEFRRLPMAHPLTLQCLSIACVRVST